MFSDEYKSNDLCLLPILIAENKRRSQLSSQYYIADLVCGFGLWF